MPIDPATGAPLPYGDQPPPELMAALMGGGGMMGGGQMMGGPPPEEAPQQSDDPVELIRQIMRDVLSPVDANEEAAIANIAAKFQQLIAAQAKEADAALGVSPAQKFMRRQAVSGA